MPILCGLHAQVTANTRRCSCASRTKREAGSYETQAGPRFALVAPHSSAAPPAVNGGVLMATVLRAVLDEAPNPHPVATSANLSACRGSVPRRCR